MKFKVNNHERMVTFLEKDNGIGVNVVIDKKQTLHYTCCCQLNDVYQPCKEHEKWAVQNKNSRYLLDEC